MARKIIFDADIRIGVADAAKAVTDMKNLEAEIRKTVNAMNSVRKSARTTADGFKDMRQMMEGFGVPDEKVRALERMYRSIHQSMSLAGKSAKEIEAAQKKATDSIVQALVKEAKVRKATSEQTQRSMKAQRDAFKRSREQWREGFKDVADFQRRINEAAQAKDIGRLRTILDQIGETLKRSGAASKKFGGNLRDMQKYIKGIIKTEEKQIATQTKVNDAFEAFDRKMGRLFTVTGARAREKMGKGYLRALTDLWKTITGTRETTEPLTKIIPLEGIKMFAKHLQLARLEMQKSGDVARSLRIAIFGLGEKNNFLAKALDNASSGFRKYARIAKYGKGVVEASKAIEQLAMNLQNLKGASRELAKMGKALMPDIDWSGLNARYDRAITSAQQLYATMRSTGEVSAQTFARTKAELKLVREELKRLFEEAKRAGQEDLAKRLKVQIDAISGEMRKLEAIPSILLKGASLVDKAVIGILKRIPFIGKAFRDSSGVATKATAGLIGKLGTLFRKTKNVSDSAANMGNTMSQLGVAANQVNEHTANVAYGFSNMTAGMMAAMGVVQGVGSALSQLDPAFGAVISGSVMMGQRFVASMQMMANIAQTKSQKIKLLVTGIGSVMTGFGVAALGGVVSLGNFAAHIETKNIT